MMYKQKEDVLSVREFTSYNMANSFLVSHISLLIHLPKGLWSKLQNMRDSENTDHIVLVTVR